MSAFLQIGWAAVPFDEDGGKDDLFVHNAVRCAECHEKMHKEWKTSAHARAKSSPVYQAFAKTADANKMCVGCHSPLLKTAAARFPAAAEGVTCDVCHSLKDVKPSNDYTPLQLQLTDTVKYGPLCDAKQHYFHKMGCSPLHEESALCGGCHQYYAKTAAGERLPVYTEFEDWQKSEAKTQGADCQSCHMPRSKGEVAKGSSARVQVGHHGLLDKDGGLRTRGLKVTAQVKDVAEQLEVLVTLHNDGAGHSVPAGSPVRRMVLSVQTLDPSGLEVARVEREYGRVLVDEAGNEAFFTNAVRVGGDSRVGPNEKRQEAVALNAPLAGSLKLSLLFRPVANALSARYRLPPQKDVLLMQKTIPFTKKGGSRTLPAIISLNP